MGRNALWARRRLGERALRSLEIDDAKAVNQLAEAAPRGFRERRVAALFSDVLGAAVDRADADFFALGGDHAAAERLLDLIDEDAGVRLPAGTLEECSTVRTLARRVATSQATRRGRVFGYGTDLPGRPLFWLIPAFQARVVAERFTVSAGRPVYVIQRAGLEGRSKPDRTTRARARRALRDIRSVQPSGPYSLAGYCSDGHVAFEVGRALREAGETVDLVIVIDVWAPVFGNWQVMKWNMHERWLRVIEWIPQRGRVFDARRRALFVREVLRDYARATKWFVLGLPAGFVQYPVTEQSRVMFELSMPFFNGYRPARADFDVALVRGAQFGGYTWTVRREPQDMSWGRVTCGHVEVVTVTGDHITMLEGETGRELADTLARLVTRHTAADPGRRDTRRLARPKLRR
jgi:thioesterase domain-containing protein